MYVTEFSKLRILCHVDQFLFFLYPLCPDGLWGPPSLLCNGYWGPFPGAKARPGRDADHSPPSSAEVVNE
jgi:hypothetical protein